MPSLNSFLSGYNQGTSTRQLPNGGGSYQAPTVTLGGFTPVSWTGEVGKVDAVTGKMNTAPVFTGGAQSAPAAPAAPAPRSKYMNPETGKYFTPQEYANYVALKIPASKATGDIGQTAGDALTNTGESATALTARATNLNNARNDIATGTTDPYKAGNKSGIAYSPQELAAIEKAYAGVYDPALNDVFARLKDKQEADKKLADREDKIFSTNEQIRAWRATTGSKGAGDDSLFTDANIKTGAARANLTIDEFKQLDSDIKNYFVSRPKVYDPVSGESSYVDENMVELMTDITDGRMTAEEGAQEIMDGDLPEAVKLYLIGRLPLTPEKKDSWFSKIMQGVGDFFSG
jgi:hypothetical protein